MPRKMPPRTTRSMADTVDGARWRAGADDRGSGAAWIRRDVIWKPFLGGWRESFRLRWRRRRGKRRRRAEPHGAGRTLHPSPLALASARGAGFQAFSAAIRAAPWL